MRNAKEGEYKAQHLSTSYAIVMPFALLFYHQDFWHNLVYYFVPLYCYFIVLVWLMRKRYIFSSILSMVLINANGGFLLTIISYYIFFHQGVLAPEVEATKIAEQNEMGLWIWWPIGVAVLAFFLNMILQAGMGEKGEALLFPLALVFLVLPFFSHHPYWAMLLNTVLFFNFCLFTAKQGDSTGAGAYSALFFFYMMAQMAALIVYAIFF
jgi:hypothetical protein